MSLLMLGCNQQSESTKSDRFAFFNRNRGDSTHKELENQPEQQQEVSASEEVADVEFAVEALKIVSILQKKEFGGLSKYIHPEMGLVFSPYSFMDSCRTLNAKQLIQEAKSDSIHLWGYYDGSGDSILMSFSEYFEAFVYCADFENGADTSINRSLHRGNSLNNFQDKFPNAVFMDFYVPGTEEYGYLDWRTLRLGFQKKGQKWFLIALIHDEWTI